MTIPRDIPLHGTGHTVGDILDAAAQAGGGSGTGFIQADEFNLRLDALPESAVKIYGGADANGNGGGNVFLIAGNDVTGGGGGDVRLHAGDGLSAERGGNIQLTPGANGGVVKMALPSTDPSVTNAVWSDNGVLVQSGHTAPSGVGFTRAVDGGGNATLTVDGSAAHDGQNGETITIQAGSDGDNAFGAGSVRLFAGDDVAGGGAGEVDLTGGAGGTTASGGVVKLIGGSTSHTGGSGGAVQLHGGTADSGDANGGDVFVMPGAGHGSGHSGNLIFLGLPAADPTVANAIWSDNGVLVQSGHTVPSGGGSGVGFTLNGSTLTLQVEAGTAEDAGQSVAIVSGSDGGSGPGDIAITSSGGIGGDWGGVITVTTGSSTTDGTGGDLNLATGRGNGAGFRGGNINLVPAITTSDAAPGHITMTLPASDPGIGNAIWSDNGVLVQSGHTASGVFIPPTSDPHVAGALWNNAGTLAISAG